MVLKGIVNGTGILEYCIGEGLARKVKGFRRARRENFPLKKGNATQKT